MSEPRSSLSFHRVFKQLFTNFVVMRTSELNLDLLSASSRLDIDHRNASSPPFVANAKATSQKDVFIASDIALVHRDQVCPLLLFVL